MAIMSTNNNFNCCINEFSQIFYFVQCTGVTDAAPSMGSNAGLTSTSVTNLEHSRISKSSPSALIGNSSIHPNKKTIGKLMRRLWNSFHSFEEQLHLIKSYHFRIYFMSQLSIRSAHWNVTEFISTVANRSVPATHIIRTCMRRTKCPKWQQKKNVRDANLPVRTKYRVYSTHNSFITRNSTHKIIMIFK